MRYADADRVFAELELSEGNPDDAAKIAHVEQLELGRAAWLDGQLGYAFGTAAAETTRTIYLNGIVRPVVLLPEPGLRSISAITVDGTAVASTAYRLTYVRPNGIARGLYRSDGGGWYGDVTITGVWGDAAGGVTVPADVVDAMTRLVIQEVRREELGPVDQAGPDGMIARPRNPYADPMVDDVVRRYRLPSRRIAV
jgi:hypothetical protein